MRILQFLIRSSGKMLAIAIFTGFLSGGSSAGLIALISQAMQRERWASGFAFLGLVGIALVTSILSQAVLIRLAQSAVFQLRMQLSRQILAAELAHLEQLGNARILATLTEDVQAVTQAAFVVPFICIDLAIVTGGLIYVISLSWQVFGMVLVLLIFAVTSTQILIRRGDRLLARAREEQDTLFKHFRSMTEGIKELKLHYFRRHSFLTDDLAAASARHRQLTVTGLTTYAMTSTLGNLLLFFAIGFVLFALPKFLTLSAGTLSSYVLIFIYLMMPMDELVRFLPRLSQAGIALDKIEALGLSLHHQGELLPPPPAIQRDWQQLELVGVTHAYHRETAESQFVLGEINVTFQTGEIVFIVGGNGSGKSTLAKLITGLYIPTTGEIRLDGQVITDHNREWYRQHFSAVFADFYLFDRLLGLDSPQLDQQAQHYLQQLQLDRKVTINAGQLSTTALSQGQRKRLTLLTAYLEDRPIYLFDEWAADQDPVFKEVFYKQFLPQLKHQGKTVLVISHDDRYFAIADRIIKLDFGKIV
jgi:putative pyoverdin transport system ATP-binding/permease protein